MIHPQAVVLIAGSVDILHASAQGQTKAHSVAIVVEIKPPSMTALGAQRLTGLIDSNVTKVMGTLGRK